MLTNQESGVSEGQEPDADSLFARMGEIDDQPEEEEQEAEEPVQEAADPEAELEEVDLEGKKYKIPKAVKPALMFQSDYTKKTQALAEQRKAFESQAQQVQAERQYYANQLSQFVQQLGQQIQQGPTDEQLIELSQRDPMAYIQAKAAKDAKIAQYQQVQYQQEQIRLQQEYTAKQQQSEFISNERATLMDKVPEWKDKAIADKEIAEIQGYASSLGYKPEELSELYDHRAYLVLRDAMRYRQLLASTQNQSKQVQAQPPKVLKPGAAPQPDGKKVPDTLVKAFRKAPTVQNMASIFEKLG